MTEHAGTTVVAIGDEIGSIELRDLHSRAVLGFTEYPGRAERLLFVRDDGELLLLITGRRGPVVTYRVTAAPTGRLTLTQRSSRPLNGAGAQIIAIQPAPGSGVWMITGDQEGNGGVWDPASDLPIREVPRRAHIPLTAAAVTTLHGRPVVVVGDGWGRLWLWDLLPLRRSNDHEIARIAPRTIILSIVCLERDGRPVAVIGCSSGEILAYDLETSTEIGRLTMPYAVNVLTAVPGGGLLAGHGSELTYLEGLS